MVAWRGVSVGVCVLMGFGCIGSVLTNHGSDSGAMVTIAAAPEAPRSGASAPVPSPAVAAVEIDTGLPTGAIAPGSALHAPNPAAYADAAKDGSSLILTGLEAVNYLAGNTLRREGPGEPLHFTYFASRGLTGEGGERGFTARRWRRDQPELCEPGAGGAALCRSVTILLDGKYEFPGARLGTVTLGATALRGSETAVLVKGNILHFPEHIPFLDSTVDVATAAPGGPARPKAAETKGPEVIDRVVGHPAVAADETGAHGRDVVLYARDNRRLELQQIEEGPEGGRAVRVTIGRWHSSKGMLCQTRVLGEAAQTCFKPEALEDGGVRLTPTGKTGEALSLVVLPETGARAVAQD